jgi:hypothetical protein
MAIPTCLVPACLGQNVTATSHLYVICFPKQNHIPPVCNVNILKLLNKKKGCQWLTICSLECGLNFKHRVSVKVCLPPTPRLFREVDCLVNGKKYYVVLNAARAFLNIH